MTDQFRDLLLAEMPRLRGYAFVLSRNQAVADDLLQETALRAWKSRTQFAMGTNFKAWVYRILRNEFISTCRRSKRAPLPMDDVAESVFAYGGDQEEKVIAREVVQALDKLPAAQREVLYLKCVSDYTYEEVAAALECSLGTVKSRLWRARNAMQKILMENGDAAAAEITGQCPGGSSTAHAAA
jgi:RNA polymerase sigma-70 factor (ECF subfamily)